MSTSTQRTRGGHGHPDRGSINLYSSRGVPLIIDPGVGWSGYNWREYVNGTTAGFWYHASRAHSMVCFGNSTTGPDHTRWTPRGDCKPTGNCTTSLYGLRGPAWVDSTTFTDDVDWVVSSQAKPFEYNPGVSLNLKPI